MELVGLTFLLAACLVCDYVTVVMALGGLFTGRLPDPFNEQLVSIKNRPARFLSQLLVYIVTASVCTVAAIEIATSLYGLL